MNKPYTLRKLIEQHPEWANLPIAVSRSDGSVDFVGKRLPGSVYEVEHGDYEDASGGSPRILVFEPN